MITYCNWVEVGEWGMVIDFEFCMCSGENQRTLWSIGSGTNQSSTTTSTISLMAGRTIFLPKMVSTLHCVCRNASTLSWQIWCWEESTGSAFSRPCRYWSNWYLRLNQIFICRISGWVNTTYHYFDSKCFPFFCSKFHGAADHGSKELLRPGLLCSHEPSGGEEHGTIPRGRRSTWMGIGDFNGDIMGYIYIYIYLFITIILEFIYH